MNLTETVLSPSDVNVNTFGKLYSTPLDGVAVAEPLYDPGVSITTGSAQGVHNVVYVATETDSLYAIDSATGSVLWKDSFLVPEAALTAGGATVTVSTVLASDVNSSDTPIIGITGTPAIDPSTNSLFLIAKTKQIVNGASTTPHFVQVLYKVDLGSGSYTSAVIGDTTYNTSNSTYVYNSGPYVLDPHAQGSGVVSAVIGGVSKEVVYFNALRSFSRVGVTIYNGNVYLGFASHGDNAPYHGWILGYSESTLAATAVFNADPDGGDDGIWAGGGKITIDSSGNMYVETGNGTFDTTLTGASGTFPGFPEYGDYGDSFIKIDVDSTTSATNQNINGWGLKVVDYFTPQNQQALSNSDEDMGSGAPMVLPASIGSVTIGSAAHPNLLVGSGKNGVIYLIDTSKMGEYHSTTDSVVQEVSNGVSGGGSYDTPSLYYDGTNAYILYAGKASTAQEYQIANGAISTLTSASTVSIGSFGSSIELSGSGTTNGIAWLVDGGANAIRAYNPTNLAQEYYDSNQDASRDALGTANKFETLTVADGQVYAANTNALVVYGLIAPPTSVPTDPKNLGATVLSNDQIQLNWTDTATNAFGYYIEDEPAGSSTWVQIGSVGSTGNSYTAVGLTPGTSYSFRVRGFNSLGDSNYSNTAVATTTNTTATLNFSSGFTSYASELTLNGATLSGTALELTDGNGSEARSAFTQNAVSVQGFSTSFTFQDTNASADGFTFTIQNQSPTAVGGSGGDLGYGGSPGITPSVAIKFDIYSNNGEGTDSTGLFIDGDPPEEPTGAYKVEASYDMTSSGVILTSGDVMKATLSYNGTVLTESVLDTSTNKSFSATYTLNIPSYVGGGYAYVGFTGGTGGETAIQKIQTWTYSPVTAVPYTPVNLTVTPASGTELDLAWNEPYSSVTNYNVLELISGTYQQIAQVPGTVTSYAAGGLTQNTAYSFEVVAANSAGSSAATTPVSGTTPYPPADISNLTYSNVTSTSATISWKNNATNATGIRITRQLESDNSQYISTFSPTTTTYTDNTLLPGRAYDYEVVATNLAGPSNGVDTIVETIPAAAATPVATASGSSITLTWAAYGHAVDSYNIYRSLTPGGEGSTPYATDIEATSFTDNNLNNGVTYYYTITAVDDGGEGPQSGEASAKVIYAPLTITSPAAYLKLDADGVHLDIWNNSTASGTSAQVLLSQISALSVNGSAAADSLTVDFSNGDPLPASGLSVSSTSGSEALTVIGTSGNDSVSVGSSAISLQSSFGSTSINYSNVSSIVFNGEAGSDTLTQTAQPGGGASVIFANTTSSDTLNVAGGTYTIPASSGSSINHQVLNGLTISAGAQLVVSSSASSSSRTLLTVNTLSIAGAIGAFTGNLDLGSNDMDIQTGMLGSISSLVAGGFGTGLLPWGGLGITSSAAAGDPTHLTALGVILNSNGTSALYGTGTALGTFDGASPSAGDILIKYTYYGDANLDGKVDGSDYSLIDSGFIGTAASGWYNGDFNYDGVVNGSDYTLIDNAFNSQGAHLAAQIATSKQSAASGAQAAIPLQTFGSAAIQSKLNPATSNVATIFAASAIKSAVGGPEAVPTAIVSSDQDLQPINAYSTSDCSRFATTLLSNPVQSATDAILGSWNG